MNRPPRSFSPIHRTCGKRRGSPLTVLPGQPSSAAVKSFTIGLSNVAGGTITRSSATITLKTDCAGTIEVDLSYRGRLSLVTYKGEGWHTQAPCGPVTVALGTIAGHAPVVLPAPKQITTSSFSGLFAFVGFHICGAQVKAQDSGPGGATCQH